MNGVVLQEFPDWFKLKTAGRKILLLINGYKAYEIGLDI
jgi:hypothetical protein